MSSMVQPSALSSVGLRDAEENHYRLAVEESRAQADSLRHAVCRANDLVRQLEELVESLRAILLYPKAYDWPAVEHRVGSGNVLETSDLDEPTRRPA